MLGIQGNPGLGSSEFPWLAVLEQSLLIPDWESVMGVRWQMRWKPGLFFAGSWE